VHFPCHVRVRFPTWNPEKHLQANAMIDSGNRVPGSAVISKTFMDAMGIQDLLLPSDNPILTASEDGQPLQVIRKIRHLYMAVSHTLVLHLHHVTVIRNLSHPLNLGGYFLREFNTRLCFDMQPAPALQAMAEPPEPLDMQQLWEMPDNMFLKKDPLLKKEVWKVVYKYRDIF
jgi:hypothetical protein